MTDVYLHVGMPKTGTTFLQKKCFPQLPGVHFAPSNFRTPPTGIVEQLWRVADAYPLFTDFEKERSEVERYMKEVTHGKLLISSERLFGDILLGFRDHFQVTESLRHLFPSGKIILTIRRQDEFLESLYREFLRAFLHPTVDGVLGFTGDGFENWIRPRLVFPSLNVWRLDYHAYVRGYAAAFGRQNITVLPLELLLDDPKRYHTRLATFMNIEPYFPPANIPVNRGLSKLSGHIALTLNRFIRAPRFDRGPLRVIPHEPFTPYLRRRTQHDLTFRLLDAINRRLSLRYVLETFVDRLPLPQGKFINDEKRRMIMQIHSESNRRLDEDYDLGLKQYGYY